ncbi:MAG: hypothetical protein AD742_06645 [Methylibium sp. NZG]|nr:MAG: hypothetical protein AD742_06645 [Methylibium sp. NZG]
MRWKLLRRRLSISAPRMIVRSRLPWPLRWAAVALMFGFSAALGLWAFEFGKDIAGFDGDSKAELAKLRVEVEQLRDEREKALSVANIAESLLKTEKAAQDKLAQSVKAVEAENMTLKSDLGFFERLLPASGSEGLTIRGLQAEEKSPGQLRFQLLVMQAGKAPPEFAGRYEVTLTGLLDGKPWSLPQPGGPKPLQLKQYLRVEGMIDHPVGAVVKAVTVRVLGKNGEARANQTLKL